MEHDQHRQRMRERLIKYGFDGFHPHETLEMLLYYVIPREDTNPTAHRLIERFGSVSGTLSASKEALMTVDGVGEKTAEYLKIVNSVFHTCSTEQVNTEKRFDTVDKVATYLLSLYSGISVERVYLLLFDNSMKLLDAVHISDGTVNCSVPDTSKIISSALAHCASVAVLAHNHPFGVASPSANDIGVTEAFGTLFHAVGIRLLDHFIVAGNQCVSMQNLGNYCQSATAMKTDPFLLHFFGLTK